MQTNGEFIVYNKLSSPAPANAGTKMIPELRLTPKKKIAHSMPLNYRPYLDQAISTALIFLKAEQTTCLIPQQCLFLLP